MSTATSSSSSTSADARVLRAPAGADDAVARTPLADADSGADRPEEVLPHRRQLPRARGGVEERQLVAPDRAVDHLLPERRRDRRPRRADHLSRAPHRGARLRARARRRPQEGRQVVLPEEAADYIGGYVIFNDITARDIQRGEMRSGVFSFCKAIDTFCPLGPWIVTPDEIPDPHDLAHGAARQRREAAGVPLEPDERDDPGDPQPLLGARVLRRATSSRPAPCRASRASSRRRSARCSTSSPAT